VAFSVWSSVLEGVVYGAQGSAWLFQAGRFETPLEAVVSRAAAASRGSTIEPKGKIVWDIGGFSIAALHMACFTCVSCVKQSYGAITCFLEAVVHQLSCMHCCG
jgi:hypothetical protein